MYTIKQASALTGVPADTLRAWERRYGVPSTSRSEGGYRLYDDHALDAVRRMRTLIDGCLLYTSPSPRDGLLSRMPSSA